MRSCAACAARGQDVITAVDTSVLLDIFGADPLFGPRSSRALLFCPAEGQLVARDVVWTETASVFPLPALAREALERLVRERVAADFLIGAHAKLQAERLLTRDRGFYRSYFAGLAVVDPAES